MTSLSNHIAFFWSTSLKLPLGSMWLDPGKLSHSTIKKKNFFEVAFDKAWFMDFVSYIITDPHQFWGFPQQRKSENYTSDTSAHRIRGWLSFIPPWWKKWPSVIWKITLMFGLSIRPSKLYSNYVTGRFTDQIEMSDSHGLFNLEHKVQPTREEIEEVNLHYLNFRLFSVHIFYLSLFA